MNSLTSNYLELDICKMIIYKCDDIINYKVEKETKIYLKIKDSDVNYEVKGNRKPIVIYLMTGLK